MKAKSIISLMLLSGILIAGCATSQKLQIVQSGDNKLSCEQLLYEMKKLEEAQAQVDSNKGVTGTNVAAFLFWLPGLAYTYYDAGQATEAIDGRKSHLTNIYNENECG